MPERQEAVDISIELAVMRLFAAQAAARWPRTSFPEAYRAAFSASSLLRSEPSTQPSTWRKMAIARAAMTAVAAKG